MTYTIKAIPTTYAGVQFRSRHEARWAAFFDLAGWKWDYEPFDLDGWAPDFMLKGRVKALVEVKPTDFSAEESAAYRQARAQAAKSYRIASMSEPPHRYEILVVGNGPFVNNCCWSLGAFALEHELSSEDIAELFVGRGRRLDYAARYGSYQYRVGGEYDGDHHLIPINDNTPEALWRDAGNLVQWKPDESANDYRPQLARTFKRRAA